VLTLRLGAVVDGTDGLGDGGEPYVVERSCHDSQRPCQQDAAWPVNDGDRTD
jgi:hypothetical protein